MKPSRIRLLPDEVVNQIAAGEVVERPASVVKELLENAIDAGATTIDVEIEHGGLGLIRVTDNGVGMTPEEAVLSLQRHATSKLTSSADLFSLSTLGFRGEALPSIAAVSYFSLTTRVAEEDAGFYLNLEHGRLVEPGKPVGAAVGTQIQVKALLGNVPARLKFMKSEATELGHIQETLVRMALPCPNIAFRLKKSGKEIFYVPIHATLLERAEAVLGDRSQKSNAVRLFDGTEHGADLQVHVCVGDPAHSSATAKNVFLFVNQRAVRDRALLHAVTSAYGTTLDAGRFPCAVVHIQLDPKDIDVNVHPQKWEVRFARPSDVYAWVQKTVRHVVERAPWMQRQSASVVQAETHQDQVLQEQWISEGGHPSASAPAAVYAVGDRVDKGATHVARDDAPPILLRAPYEQARWSFDDIVQPNSQQKRLSFSRMQYLGQVHRTYLVCKDQEELVLIDQHAAHERVAFERLCHSYAQKRMPSQRLLLPVTLQGAQVAVIEEHLPALEQMGFEFRNMAEREMAMVMVPQAAEFGRGAKTYQEPHALIQRVLADLEEKGATDTVKQQQERVLATIACHSVLRAGDLLTDVQARALLDSMDEFDLVPYCPHGRPVLIRLGSPELEKRFGRC